MSCVIKRLGGKIVPGNFQIDENSSFTKLELLYCMLRYRIQYIMRTKKYLPNKKKVKIVEMFKNSFIVSLELQIKLT